MILKNKNVSFYKVRIKAPLKAVKHQRKNPAYAPIQPHVGQTPVEGNHVAGHQIKLVNFKQLLHFLLLVLGDDHRLAHLSRTLVAPRYYSCNRGETREKRDEGSALLRLSHIK